MRLNDTLKELCAKTGTQEAGIERLLDYYIDGFGWSEDSAAKKDGEEKPLRLF